MAESLDLPKNASRAEVYEALFPQVQALLAGETDWIANLANVVAALKEAFGFFWVGFYRVQEGQLVLGPFQGPIACTRIAFDRGVCGHAYRAGSAVIVPDVERFPGHIACSSLSKSEIVVPVRDSSGAIIAVLDVDSDRLNDFSEVDREGLEKILDLLKGVTL
ncbi:MAG: GAF domain-containing protein [Bdellovibrionales bacterium]|nr:GAF domain-containing protein [Bdellovibrionales bacterium]